MLFAALIWIGNGGCLSSIIKPSSSTPTVEPPPPTGTDPNAAGPDRGPGLFRPQAQRLTVEFKVHRFSAPSGTFSSSEADIWRLVSNPLPDAGVMFRLKDNGFRAAIGRESDREALRKWLDDLPGVRSALDTAVPDAARTVEIEVGMCPPRQTVFYYDRRGVLHGLDFIKAKARFRLAFEMRSANLHEVWVEIVPELEEPPGPPKWVITPQGAKQEPEERRHTFTDLTFSAQVPEGGFLVLGPTPAVRESPLVANPFLVEPAGSGEQPAESTEDRESIYVISPIIRSQSQGPAAGGGPKA